MSSSPQRKGILQPQEIEVFYIIPTLRKHLAIAMKKQGMKQSRIAELLEIQNATVSQYIKGKRGDKIKFPEKIVKEIEHSSSKIHDKISLIRETQKILLLIRNTGALCTIHKQLSPTIPCSCNPNLTGCFRTHMTSPTIQ